LSNGKGSSTRIGPNQYSDTGLTANSFDQISNINNKQYIPSKPILFLESLTKPQMSKLGKLLKEMGYTVRANKEGIKYLFATAPELQEILKTSNNSYSKLIENIQKDRLVFDDEEKEVLPTRTITEQDPNVIKSIIDKIYLKEGMRRATPEEKQKIFEEIKKDIAEGTLTTTKKVKNPKTGKMENVTTVKSAFSQGKFEAGLEEKFRKENPKDFDTAKRIEFSNFLNQRVYGEA